MAVDETLAKVLEQRKGTTPRDPPKVCCLSRILFAETSGIISLAARQGKLELSDVWGTPAKAAEVYEEFQNYWAEEQRKPRPLIRRVMFRMVASLIYTGVALQGFATVMQLLGPMILNQILRYIEKQKSGVCDKGSATSNSDPLCNEATGYILCGLLFVTLFLAALAQNHTQLLFLKAALKVRGALISAVYHKMMRLSSVGMGKTGAGMINNLAANDTEQLLTSTPILGLIFFAPVIIIVAMALLAVAVGASFLGGFGAMFLVLFSCAAIIKKGLKYKLLQVQSADNRVKLTNEIISGVRIVKAYGWERPYEADVMKLRNQETYQLRMQAAFLSVLSVVILSSPVILAVVTFSIYSATGNELTAATVFTAIALLNLIRFPMAFLPFGVSEIIKISVTMGRLQRMLQAEEMPKLALEPPPSTAGPGAITVGGSLASIADSEFGYPVPEAEPAAGKGKGKGKGRGLAACLGRLCGKGGGKGKGGKGGKGEDDKGDDAEATEPADLTAVVEVKRGNGEVAKLKRVLTVGSFQAARGGLTMVVGPVGSGKSSLLAALLGEMELISGSWADMPKRIAYAAQVPWIVNATLEDNIKFAANDRGHQFYQNVLDASCLRDDLALLPGGDQTEIGERGINMSGGQRARVSIARTIYQDADIYLFDDPLAAVDAHVGKKLVNRVFAASGILADKTRVLVTHQVQFLPLADWIIVLEGGQVSFSGNYDAMLAEGSRLESYLAGEQVKRDGKANEEEEEDAVANANTAAPAKLRSTVVNGAKDSPADLDLAKTGVLVKKETAAEGRVQWSTYRDFVVKGYGRSAAVATVLALITNAGAKIITDFWLAFWTAEKHPWGLTTWGCIGVYFGLACVQALFIYSRSFIVSAIGLIRACRNIYQMLFHSVISAPVVFFDLTPTGRLLNRFTSDMDVIDNQMARLVGQTFGVTETVLGVIVGISIVNPVVLVAIGPCALGFVFLSAYYRPAARDVQRLENITKSPIFNRISETLNGLQTVRAFGYQQYLTALAFMEIDDNQACNLTKLLCSSWLGLRLEFLSLTVTTVFAILSVSPFGLGRSSAAFVGVALTYGLELSRYIQALSKSSTDFEQKFTSVERIFEYCALQKEAAETLPLDTTLAKPWPPKGGIEFRNVTMRYRPELEPALRGLTFAVQAGEKLGVVGRTGSGKSSIIVTLLRLTEPQAGVVTIDGQDLRQLGLRFLRQSLAYIPQEPVLFGKTTLRSNLDPFGQAPESELEAALAKVRMGGKDALPDGLSTEVQEGGAPFSVGQRQLLCLARAVLRKSKVILLDEATASVDNETDALIQQTIRETFSDSTVLCIAHRIRTILDSDKVLVMGAGVCQELGTPKELLARGDSQLRLFAIQSGIEVPSVDPDVESVSV